MTQEERLNTLLDRFLRDAGKKTVPPVGDSIEEKRSALRALMNVRMPHEMDAETLALQDEYLRYRAEEKGIVAVEDIPSSAADPCLSVWQGDITRLAADAIVNAANGEMLGCFIPCHSCIDNCIHTFAGIQLRAECARNMESLRARRGRTFAQPTAVPMLTNAYNLPAKKVVHIVGPVVEGMLTPALERALADCYTNTLDRCLKNGLRSVAFCCISTGAFHFPKDRAAHLAVKTVREWLAAHPDGMDRVIFNVFSDADRVRYEAILQSLCPAPMHL